MTMFCSGASTTDNKVTKEELSKALHDAVVVAAAAAEGGNADDPKGGAELSILSKDQYEEILDVWVDAFQKDPMISWCVNLGHDDDVNKFDENQKQLLSIFSRAFLGWVQRVIMKRNKGFTLGVVIKNNDVGSTTTNHNNNSSSNNKRVIGAISVVPSAEPYMTFWDMVSNAFALGPMPTMGGKSKQEYGPFAAQRLIALSVLDKKRDEIMMAHEQRQRFVYVQSVGVLTSCQGQKIGSKMFRLLLNVADSLEAYLYLETQSLANESLYKHFGFYTKETVDVSVEGDNSSESNTTLRMYLMIRDPQ